MEHRRRGNRDGIVTAETLFNAVQILHPAEGQLQGIVAVIEGEVVARGCEEKVR